jgi:hypothetical protein
MGRYTSVQAYADNNSNVRTVPYEQATGSAEPKKGGGTFEVGTRFVFVFVLATFEWVQSSLSHYQLLVHYLACIYYYITVKADKVINPYGSTAGAGSGDFHVYRHARSREMARWKALDEEEEKQELESQFEEELKSCKNEQERKTARNRRKRQREKTAKLRKKNLKAAGIEIDEDSPAQQDAQVKGAGGEEFTYTPEGEEEKGEEEKKQEEKPQAAKLPEPVVEEIPNDGSFLELMKKRLAEEEAQKQGQAKRENSDDEEGPAQPPAKKRAITTQIFDIDDE